MTDDVSCPALLRRAGAVGIGAGALALFPSLAAVAPLTKVLMFARTAGSRHHAVPAGVAAIPQLGDQNGDAVDGANRKENLAWYQAVVWLSTSGGVHAAVHTEHNWAWHGSLAGAYFAARQGQRQAMLIVEDHTNDPTAHLPATWNRFDDRTHPCGAVSVLMCLDESAHSDDTMGTWWHAGGAGRARYTGLGHTTESHSDTLFTRMPLGDIRVAVRAIPANQDDVENRARERQLIRRWEERECRT